MDKELEQPVATEEFIENKNTSPSENINLGGRDYREFETNSKDISHNPTDEFESSISQDKNANLQNFQKENIAKENSSHGSNERPFGKFDSADALLKAYNSLQSEFTRKCQAIANASSENPVRPVDAYNEIKSRVNEFANNNSLAKKYESELLEKVLSDTSSDSMLAIKDAYTQILESHFASPDELAKSEEFLSKYIYSDDELCDKILANVVDKIQASSAPRVLTRSSGSAISLTPINKPADLKEAGELAKSLLKK